jgi:hypothetical protein
MASTDDINSTLKGTVTGLSQMSLAFGAPGRTLQTTLSPVATILSALGPTVQSAVAFNANRRAISFHNSNPGGTTIWITPAGATAAIGQGVPIVPGGDFVIDTLLGSNCGWNAIANATTVLCILEFV